MRSIGMEMLIWWHLWRTGLYPHPLLLTLLKATDSQKPLPGDSLQSNYCQFAKIHWPRESQIPNVRSKLITMNKNLFYSNLLHISCLCKTGGNRRWRGQNIRWIWLDIRSRTFMLHGPPKLKNGHDCNLKLSEDEKAMQHNLVRRTMCSSLTKRGHNRKRRDIRRTNQLKP